MKITETLLLTSRDDWRAWLEKNYNRKKEVWLIFYKKHTGKPTIPYESAIEEAICFGWIDSIVRKTDHEMYARRFTPRTEKSKWSDLNMSRARKMMREGRMMKSEVAKLREIEKLSSRTSPARKPTGRLAIPADLKEALVADQRARENFNNFAASYKKLYIAWITDAKKEVTRQRRIRQTVTWASQNRKPGIDMKYD